MKYLFVLFMLCFKTFSAFACTGITLKSEDRGVIYGRTMEWGAFDLNSRIAVIPQNYKFSGSTPDGKNGLKWKAKYGFIGFDALKKDFIADGVNEKGLAVGLFYHPGFASYPKYKKKFAKKSLGILDLGNFILSSFKNVKEVRKGLKKVRIAPIKEKALGIVPPLHLMVTDRKGKSIVIEFKEGKTIIFENDLGVLTNAPTFDWHLINLRNFINLSNVAIPSRELNQLNFKPLGAGSGMIGLPGDFTPPSRFVRAVAWTQTARKMINSTEAVYEVIRILDNFQIPLPAQSKKKKDFMRSATLWTSSWDLKRMKLYYHTQHSRRLRMVNISKIDFSPKYKKIRHLPLDRRKHQDIEELKF